VEDRQPTAEASEDPIDRAQWERILDEVGVRVLRRYAAAYLDLLPERLDGVECALALGAWTDAVRIMADLHASSAMLGALRLAALAERVQSELESVSGGRRSPAVWALRGEACAVDRTVRQALDGLSGRQGGQSRADSPNR
jgi:HPt (histidine-containing phosphotransfer) domain-containing protein